MKHEIRQSKYRICGKCGYFCPKKSEFEIEYCSRCGSLMKESCNYCHMDFTDPFARFCRRCGEKIFDDLIVNKMSTKR